MLKKALLLTLSCALYGVAAPTDTEQPVTYQAVADQLNHRMFFAHGNYAIHHAREFVPQMTSTQLSPTQQKELWKLFLRRLMTLLVVSQGEEQYVPQLGADEKLRKLIVKGETSLGKSFLSDLAAELDEDGEVNDNSISISETEFPAIFALKRKSFGEMMGMARTPLALIALTVFLIGAAASGPKSKDRLAVGGILAAAVTTFITLWTLGVVGLVAACTSEIETERNKSTNFEIFIARLRNVINSDAYRSHLPPELYEKLTELMNSLAQNRLPAQNDADLQTELAALQSRYEPLNDFYTTSLEAQNA